MNILLLHAAFLYLPERDWLNTWFVPCLAVHQMVAPASGITSHPYSTWSVAAFFVVIAAILCLLTKALFRFLFRCDGRSGTEENEEFWVDGEENYILSLKEEMRKEIDCLENQKSGVSSDEEREAVEDRIREVRAKYRNRISEADRYLF